MQHKKQEIIEVEVSDMFTNLLDRDLKVIEPEGLKDKLIKHKPKKKPKETPVCSICGRSDCRTLEY